MNRQLRQRADLIIQQHPNIITKLFKTIKSQLPLGLGEGKIKGALADNIPEWVYDLSESDLKEFIEQLQSDPEFYRWLLFNIKTLEKTIYEE